MTIPVNLAGSPGMSVPCGFDAVGLQIVGNVLREDLMFQVAYAFEQATEWHKAMPKL
jgi:aspartyl-tRNA(Asn)/glutamyl-tRNA(Gln) amidotransferase subunit A